MRGVCVKGLQIERANHSIREQEYRKGITLSLTGISNKEYGIENFEQGLPRSIGGISNAEKETETLNS
jgi:hypothetical protein